MSDAPQLSASVRERAGKGAARAARRDNLVPAVIYGDKRDPVMINLKFNELLRLLQRPGFYTNVFEFKVGAKTERVLARDVQFDPVKDLPIHVDFLRVRRGSTIVVQVPVHFENEEEAPGLKEGGILNVVRHEIGLNCPVDSIPDAITVDLTGLQIGDTVHISAVTLPEGITPEITDRDFTVATIAGRAAEPEPEDEETAEGEEAEGEEGAEDEGAEGSEEEEQKGE